MTGRILPSGHASGRRVAGRRVSKPPLSKQPLSKQRGRERRYPAGFTLLEILMAMAIFTVLGTMLVWFMRTSLEIFTNGMRESDLMDRADTVLPRVRDDLRNLIIPDDFDPPAIPPSGDALDGREPPPPRPPEPMRLRSGFVKMRDTGDPVFKDYACRYLSFVVADAGEWADPLKRRAGEVPVKGAGLKALTPETVQSGDRDSRYLPTGGLMEVVWIAVPQDLMVPPEKGAPRFPAILSLYRGFRTPIGDPEKSLLIPENLDTAAKIRKSCRLIAEGLVHFGAVWRRSFATDWVDEQGVGLGETAAYVGPVWDSTRALDKEWGLFRGKESLNDPSDDIFPAFVRLEATLVTPSQFGHGRGELTLMGDLGTDTVEVPVSEADTLLGLDRGKDRWLKIDGEWMHFEIRDVRHVKRIVRVRRGMRGTKKSAHSSGAWIYVGQPNELEIRLPVFRDRSMEQERLGK